MTPIMWTVLGVGALLLVGSFVFKPILAKLGWNPSGGALDKVSSALTAALLSVEKKVFLSPLGRAKICDLLIFLEGVIRLFPDGPIKDGMLAARVTLLNGFGSAPDDADTPSVPSPPAVS